MQNEPLKRESPVDERNLTENVIKDARPMNVRVENRKRTNVFLREV